MPALRQAGTGPTIFPWPKTLPPAIPPRLSPPRANRRRERPRSSTPGPTMARPAARAAAGYRAKLRSLRGGFNTSSINEDNPRPALLAYATTKGAIANFTAGLAQSVARRGIRVNAVAPGPVWTPLIPSTMKCVEGFRQKHAAGPRGATGGTGACLCSARLR